MQLCAAYRAAGGKTVAVLSCRPKLEMEELFASTIPRSRRYKTRFVFRQVSAQSQRTAVPCYRKARSAWQTHRDHPSLFKSSGPNVDCGRQGLCYERHKGLAARLIAVAHAVQGSPLVPEHLKRVAAAWASSIIVVSDCSRCSLTLTILPTALRDYSLPMMSAQTCCRLRALCDIVSCPVSRVNFSERGLTCGVPMLI